MLEYSTPRAGEIEIVGRVLGPTGKEIGLGVVNPRTDEIESVEQIVERVEEALKFYAPSAVFLNPDCGFGTFASRCVANEETAVRKMRRIVEAAHVMRDKYAPS